MMSLSEGDAELKCSATGKPGELFRTLRRRSLKRSRSRLPVSPVQRRLCLIAQGQWILSSGCLTAIGFLGKVKLLCLFTVGKNFWGRGEREVVRMTSKIGLVNN